MKKNRKEVFIMKNQKMWRGFVIGLCLSVLAGCGTGANEKTGDEDMHAAEYQSGIWDDEGTHADENSLPDGNKTDKADASQETQDPTAADGKVDAGSLYASAAMKGSVVDFSDNSCTVSAAVSEDDGKTGVIAAPGCESEETNVVITYQEDCVVQIATIDTSTGMAELEQASVSDIKKQASVLIYGSFEDAHHVSATKIIIYHFTA